ncbi:MAG: flagellin FliC5 [Lachnospiraceae bacterium]|nr:flagellin FliC5 [Lachnospiraceae bacterium]
MNSISKINSNVNYGGIASGKKLNSAADGASELSIAAKLQAQSNGLTVGADNAKAGNSVLNIADGALSGIQDYLHRIKEISVKASNGLNSSQDKQAMQSEINELMKGIQSTAKGTQFNTMSVLDGSMADMNIATNPDGTGMQIQMGNSTLEALGIDGYDVTGDFDMKRIDNALDMVSASRSSMGASSNALDYITSYNTNGALQQTGAQSKLEDLDIPQAISDLKKNQVMDDYKNTMLKQNMEQESIVTKMLQ